MPDDPSRNLTLSLGSFGPITFQPDEFSEDELHRSRYLVFPDRISEKAFDVAVEWAAHSESPIFCTAHDVRRFVKEGFGAYRFNTLGGFREIGFEKGSLKFVPARTRTVTGLRGWLKDLGDAWGLISRESYHVIAKPERGESHLYLSSPYIDLGEWKVLSEDRPTRIYGSPEYPSFYWLALSEKLGTDIRFFARVDNSTGATQKIFPDLGGNSSEKVFKKSVWLPLDRSNTGPSSSSL